MYDLVSSGFDAKESIGILGSTAKAATAGLTTTEVSTKAVAAALNAYKLPASAAGDVSDTLFRTVDRGVVSFDALANNIGTLLPFASTLGVSLNEVGASIATLTKQGIGPEETMTRIQGVMTQMLKPSKALQQAYKELGVESGEQLIKQKGFQGAIEAVTGAVGGNKQQIAKLFPDVRGLSAALALTGNNAKGARTDLKDMGDSVGATDKALSQQSKSVSYQWSNSRRRLRRSASVSAPT